MAAKINWSIKANRDFEKIIDWLFTNWSEREVENFVSKVDKALVSIAENPNMYRTSKVKPTLINL